jgi:hypothetical protein
MIKMTSEELYELVKLEKQIEFFERVINSAESGSGIYIYTGDMSRADGKEIQQYGTKSDIKSKILKVMHEELEIMREKFGAK